MTDVSFQPKRVINVYEIPSPAVPGVAYFVASEKKIYIGLSNGTVEEYAGGGGGASVVDTLAGNEHDKAPSVHAVNDALAAIPAGDSLYRGPFNSLTDLETAHPTDVAGAYATVNVSGTYYMHFWNDSIPGWQDSGIAGPFVESVNGELGPAVVLDYADVGAAPASHATDMTMHVTSDEKAILATLPGALGFNKIKVGAVIID
jgi:hypothetical protein